jgi:VanZ family protein
LIISTVCLVAAGLLAVAILVFTHLPNDKVPSLIVRIGDDKLRHVLSYGLFSALLFLGLRPWLPNLVKALAWVALIGTVFSIVDELTQPFTGRTCSFQDFLASFGGTLLGSSAIFIVAALGGRWCSETAPAGKSPETVRMGRASGTATKPIPRAK